MSKKLRRFQDRLKEDLKDPVFRRAFKQEGLQITKLLKSNPSAKKI